MTSHKIGVNLRVSGNCDQGGRKYMEDYHAIKFIKKDDRDYEFAYFGIFDGHGGPEASRFARDNLLNEITKYDQFWTDNDDDVMYAIRCGFLDTHQLMWKELDKWPRTVSGLPSTSGTTASIAIIKKCKLYIGHVGDSGIVLGCDEGPRNAIFMKPKCLTKDHKPDNPEEKERIERSGGSVVAKAGVQRVVWSRPKVNHKGPIRRSTQIDKIPFLAVARSLGDLWSYDYFKEQFVVSPDPDVSVMTLEPGRHRCLVLGSDGLWNMLSAAESVSVVTDLEMHFEDRVIHDPMVSVSYWINPAEKLVSRALNKWRSKLMKADNISCVVVLIDPLGPSKLTILRKRREEHFQKMKESKATMGGGMSTASSRSTADSSMTGMASPSTSGAVTKANYNQNNLVGERRENQRKEAAAAGGVGDGEREREKAGKGEKAGKEKPDRADRDADSENKSKNGAGEGGGSAVADSGGGGGGGGGSSGGGGHSGGGGSRQPHSHSLRSSSHSPPSANHHHHRHHHHHHHPHHHRILHKAASASKVGKPQHASQQADSGMRYPLCPRRLSHPSLTAAKAEDVMEDSAQATSVLTVSSVFGSPLLSPSSENPGAPPILDPSPAAHMLSSMPLSNSLLKLMKLDAVKASSTPLSSSMGGSMSASVLNQSHPSGSKGGAGAGAGAGAAAAVGREQKKPRRSLQGALSLPSRQHSAPFLESAPEVKPTLLPSSHHASKTFPRAAQNSRCHGEPPKDVELASTRILRVATSQRSSSSSGSGSGSGSSSISKSDSTSSPDSKAASLSHKSELKAADSKALADGPQSAGGSSLRRIKKRREFGLLHRTRTTLRRARRAARKAFCPENRPFLKQRPGGKRKREDKPQVASAQSPAKRLKKNDGLRCSS